MNPFLVIALLSQVAASESIVVTATRTETRIADTPGSVVILSKKTLDSTAALTIDDALRQVPGFTLFRRAGSRVANPTTQGVSLRGVGAGGASRALVLDAGVPLNDPFGGWIYWGRVPREALQRVEVLRGGASDLYGSSAMGGVVQFIRRTGPGVSARISAGSEQTGDSSAFAGFGRGGWNGSIAADARTTDGYVLVRPDQRGSVDVNADSRHTNIEATIRHGSAFFRAAHYREARSNGTPLQQNDTTIRQLSIGSDGKLGRGLVTLRAYVSNQSYFQTFSSVAAGRNSERLTTEQRVPSHGSGGNAQWTRTVGNRHVVVAGAELRAAGGRSDERRFTANGPISVTAGGRQETVAVYIEDLFAVTPSLSITAGARADGWRITVAGLGSRKLT